MRKLDLIGQRFGKLTVVGPTERRGKGMRIHWKCQCDCGNTTWSETSNLRAGNTNSCGCLHKQAFHEAGQKRLTELREQGVVWVKHGLTGTRIHNVWRAMKDRCLTPTNPAYPDYGGRGITICPEWIDDLPAFYKAVGDPPTPYHSIDRIDNDKGYEPGNVRWATVKEQNAHRRPRKETSQRTKPKKYHPIIKPSTT